MSLSVRGFAVAVVTAAAAVLPVLAAAPASATTSDCLEYLEGAGFPPNQPRVDACDAGEQGNQDFCRNLLTWTQVPPAIAREACVRAEQG